MLSLRTMYSTAAVAMLAAFTSGSASAASDVHLSIEGRPLATPSQVEGLFQASTPNRLCFSAETGGTLEQNDRPADAVTLSLEFTRASCEGSPLQYEQPPFTVTLTNKGRLALKALTRRFVFFDGSCVYQTYLFVGHFTSGTIFDDVAIEGTLKLNARMSSGPCVATFHSTGSFSFAPNLGFTNPQQEFIEAEIVKTP